MKKITYEQACKMISKGKSIKCRISKREEVIIKNKSDLDAKKLLKEQGVQEFELYENKENVEIPKNAMQVTIDEAFELVGEMELIYYKTEEGEEEIATGIELNQLVMSSRIRGEEPLLYWYV